MKSNALSFIRLGDIADFRNGLNFSKESHGKGCPLIGVGDFKDNFSPKWDELEEINPDGVSKVEDYLKEGDLLFVRSNGNKALVGRSLYINKDIKALYSGFCIRARLKTDDICPLFLAYFTKTQFFRDAISFVAGTNINNLNQGILSEVRIPSYSKEKQALIVKSLSSIDKKIELNNRINAELEAMAKTLYDYWFVQFDFPDENGKPYKASGGKMIYNHVLKRETPEDWKVNKLVEITSLIRRGISPKYTEESGTQVLNQKCIRNQKISFEDSRRHQAIMDDDDERLLKPFDVLVNSTGVGTLGRVAYVKRLAEKKTTVDSHVSIVRANPDKVCPRYLAWKLMRYQPVIEAAANGSTGQVELSKSFLEDLDVIIPSDSVAKKFSEFVEPIAISVAKRESENEQLISLRDWLLPMLMNGQVTVTPSTEPQEAQHG
ncbi:restriction endonuclease subunit S [Vibrio fluvialis]|uniref:restriction endonuclease subunit S n=1 Tax=Vibrio fluvialis TaxID=676 RepID=UPI00192A7DF3|nr:restriction endonuclease subunit S [Vibrio fluvialis]MBL4305994.1 restriction endonuclease subunit S [Vibrio fluvialis]